MLFRGDDNDTTRLVYREKVFNSELSVFNFLEYQFSVNDDCQGAENLQLIIEPLSGSCRETNYTVRPLQNIPACNGRNSSGPPLYIPFQNPLRGEAAIVTVQLDYDPPVIQCGFHRECIPGINVVSPDGRTLYHYRSKQTDISDYEWNKAKFFYNVVVSYCVSVCHKFTSKCRGKCLSTYIAPCLFSYTTRITVKLMFKLM